MPTAIHNGIVPRVVPRAVFGCKSPSPGIQNPILEPRTVLVIGDFILDRYLYGTANRLSPEAPVPVVRQTSIERRLGGAGNVAANIVSLGGIPIPIGYAGDNSATIGLLFEHDIRTSYMYSVTSRKTPTKTRVVAHNHQVCRIDDETSEPISRELEAAIIREFMDACSEDYRAIVLSDYNKGVITSTIFDLVIEMAATKNVPVLLDPKPANAAAYPRHVAYMTPNEQEARDLYARIARGSGWKHDPPLSDIGIALLEHYRSAAIVITRGEHGMTVFGRDFEHEIPATAQQVFDVSGAGDTVIAALSLSLANGFDIVTAARVANAAAGVVVGRPGTATVTQDEMRK